MLTDDRIASLLAEPKPVVQLTATLVALGQAAPKRSHRRHAVTLRGEGGNHFVLHLRQSALNAYDFSVILTHVASDGRTTNLRRHNGPSHQHRNHLEGTAFRGRFHIHRATERYQVAGYRPEDYAEPTERFSDLSTAMRAMLEDATFASPDEMTFPI